jgi:succinoglycan biosynthesis protein ExoW
VSVITVVIPYFQRESGILRRALGSVAAQTGSQLPLEVIVVDDTSPTPAEPEVAAVAWPPHMQCRVITRPNGGPGAARNTGLDAVRPDAQYLAFLDSDDEWLPHHLASAVTALDCGFDFYFADLYQLDQSVGAFARAGRLKAADHPLLDTPIGHLHAFQGDLFDQTLRGNVIGTPTVVYRWQRFAGQRFMTEFTSAGEDYLFWMALARAGAKAAFGAEVAVRCGRGVNVYAGSGWGTPQHLLRVHQEILYRNTVRRLFNLNPAQAEHVRRDLSRLRGAFARDLVHRLRHRQAFPPGLLRKHFGADPGTLFRLPLSMLEIVKSRA